MFHGMPKVPLLLLFVCCGFGQGTKLAVKVVPERYLRDHDPITVFFPNALGPEQGGPADDPGEAMRLEPEQNGEFRWLDGKTLQFTPAVAWPPLSRVQLSCMGEKKTLWTLMSAPRFVTVQPGDFELERFDSLTLSFSSPIPHENLARLLRFEVRPLPGQGDTRALVVNRDGFEIRALEPVQLGGEAQYLIRLKTPVLDGQLIKMILELSLDPTMKERFATYNFATKPLFRLTGVRLGEQSFPISAKGSQFAKDQAVALNGSQPRIALEFSHYLGAVPLQELKRIVRLEPEVRNFRHEIQGKRIALYFDMERERSYRLTLSHGGIRDQGGRVLTGFADAVLWFYQAKGESRLGWGQPEGLLERFGAQELPMEGQGMAKLDLRIHKLDPLDRRYWPIEAPIAVDETVAPPLSGIQPELSDQAAQIRLLGSPQFSRIVSLPLREAGPQMRFGLDLAGPLAEAFGAGQPGHYLVGYRVLGPSTERIYARVQVTDLSVSWVEHRDASCDFLVRSLKTALPVAGAQIQLEGYDSAGKWSALFKGQTNALGLFHYEHREAKPHSPERLQVRHGDDVLVLAIKQLRSSYADREWRDYQSFFYGVMHAPLGENEREVQKGFLFTERPIYRPDEAVHIRGYVRKLRAGHLLKPTESLQLLVKGPGDQLWHYPIELDEYGGFYQKFDEPNLPTGTYSLSITQVTGETWDWDCGISFKKEAYRIPRFEVRLTGPEFAPSDRPFEVSMYAQYFAGGRVVDQPLRWRVNRLDYTPNYEGYPGFLFSSDERFGTTGGTAEGYDSGFETRTDANGAATLLLDPSNLRDARPHSLVIEAEVTGADQQSVANSKRIVVNAPFALGIKTDRVLKKARTLKAEVLVLGPYGKPREGLGFRFRLLHRRWHSYVKESDFTTGKAQYVTEVEDKLLETRDAVSTGMIQPFEFSVGEPGVFVMELSAKDQLSRLVNVSVDLFAGGEGGVAWKKPQDLTFDAKFDKKIYAPGEMAHLIVESPFQNAEAMVLVEGPEGPSFFHQPVREGQAIVALQVQGVWSRSVPVTIMLERGRILAKSGKDELLKPRTLMASAQLNVKPLAFQAELKLKHPSVSLPGRVMPIRIEFSDPEGKPLDGVATLWLVDRAVLSLGRERNLDPLKNFTMEHPTNAAFFSSRNLVLGDIPLEEMPGGDGGTMDDSVFDRATVRKNFKTVPFYQAVIQIHKGIAQVDVQLPDDITEFAIRAVAVSGLERFSHAKSQVAVRVPVLIQTALPRFVRPGDRFHAGGIGRIVDGDGGPGQVEIRLDGLRSAEESKRSLNWPLKLAVPLLFPLEVTREAAVPGEPPREVTVSMAVSREVDGASDAFEVKLPIRPDRFIRTEQHFEPLPPGETLQLAGTTTDARLEGFRRDLVLANKGELLDLAAALDFNFNYPFGCTEQQISQAFPLLALRNWLEKMGQGARVEDALSRVADLQVQLAQRQDSNGLYAYWPGSGGQVALTAYVVDFLVLCKELQLLKQPDQLERAIQALQNALRSDAPESGGTEEGVGFYNRAYALYALARAGRFDPGYGFELGARALTMPLADEARIYRVLADRRSEQPKLVARIEEDLWKSIQFEQQGGQDLVRGVALRELQSGGLHRPSGGSFAEVVRALLRADAADPRIKPMVAELLRRGRNQGWYDTQGNAATLLALADFFSKSPPPAGKGRLTLSQTGANREIDLAKMPVVWEKFTKPDKLVLKAGGNEGNIGVWTQLKYLPLQPGAQASAVQKGFVIERRLLVYEGGNSSAQPRIVPVADNAQIQLKLGDLIEEHVRIVNPGDQRFVAVRVPLAAGFEPLNPNLETAPAEAQTAGEIRFKPTYADYQDDQVTFFYDFLPKGSYDFYFRGRANTAGEFTQPPARAELMYQPSVYGDSSGAKIEIQR